MAPRPRRADHALSRRTAWVPGAGCLAYLLFLVAMLEVLGALTPGWLLCQAVGGAICE